MITYKIYGMHYRDDMISVEKQRLGLSDSDIFYDDRPNGGLALYTAKKAWLAQVQSGETHRVVFPDDIETCNGFKDICETISATHPDCIVSFFLWDGRHKDTRLENLTTPYVRTKLCIGAGIMMPTRYIDECFGWIKETYNDNIADDVAIQEWANYRQIPIISTIPSLIQHLGDASLLTADAPIRRCFYYDRNPVADWTCKEVASLSLGNKFRPAEKAVIRCENKN